MLDCPSLGVEVRLDTRNWMRWAIYFVLAILVGIFLYNQLALRQPQPDIISVQDLATEIKEGKVARIAIEGNTLDIERVDDSTATAYKERDTSLVKTLENLGVDQEALSQVVIEVTAPSGLFSWLGILSWVLPLILISAFFLIIFRQAQSSGNQAISFGKSRARMFTGEKPTITFDDVAGVEEAKQELNEVVEFLKEPQKFIALGARIPKGVILMGAP